MIFFGIFHFSSVNSTNLAHLLQNFAKLSISTQKKQQQQLIDLPTIFFDKGTCIICKGVTSSKSSNTTNMVVLFQINIASQDTDLFPIRVIR